MATISAYTQVATRFESTQVTGVAPLVVASTTLVDNLTAEYLGAVNQDAAFFRDADNLNAGTLLDARVAETNVTQHEAALSIATSQLSDTLGETGGGTGLATYTLGDLLYASAADTLAALAGNTTTAKQFLSQTGDGNDSAAPAWASLAAGDILSGEFHNDRISESSVTNHEAALSITYSQLSDASAVLDEVQDVASMGTEGQILRVDSGGGFEFTDFTADAFSSVANSGGTQQFAASGADALQFAAGSDLGVAFDSENNRITFSYTGAGGGGMTGLAVKDDGTTIGTRTGINLHEGTGVTLTITDDGANDEVDITIAAASALDDLTDVEITAAATGDLLRFDGSNWVDVATIGASNLDLTDDYDWTGAHTFDDLSAAVEAAADTEILSAKVTSDSFDRVQVLSDDIKMGDGTAAPKSIGRTVAARLYLRSSQLIPDSTQTTVLWDGETLDTDGFHEGVTNPERLTIPAGLGGTYLISAKLAYAVNGTGFRRLRINLNGTLISIGYAVPGSTDPVSISVTEIRAMSAGDYFEVTAEHSSGGDLNLAGHANAFYCAVSLVRIGD